MVCRCDMQQRYAMQKCNAEMKCGYEMQKFYLPPHMIKCF